MSALFAVPNLDDHDRRVIAEVNGIKRDLAGSLRPASRWKGGLRRTTQARAIRGSNTIEGYVVTAQDALAAVDDEAPMSADERTWTEIKAYQRVLTYVVNVAVEPGFQPDVQTINAMHFMLLEHDLAKSPGRFRTTEIYVHDERDQRNVYQGPDPERVPLLMEALAASLREARANDPMVTAAMAHLNLVMIHPYRDGNGRMARVVQTMVLARDRVLSPEFASIEEWLGSNTDDYYRVLAVTGQGSWHPENDARLWVQFSLRAHHLQAQTLRRRVHEAERLWGELDHLQERLRLPEAAGQALFDAYLGAGVTRASYAGAAHLDLSSATRHLQHLADAGLLEAKGQTRGRHYVAGEELRALRSRLRETRQPLGDPYPELRARLYEPAGGGKEQPLF